MGFRIVTGAGPVCSAVGRTYRKRCKWSTNLAEHWWIKHRTHFVNRECLHRLFAHFWSEVNQVIDGHSLTRVGRGLGRERLRWGVPLARHITLRYRPLFNWPDRLAGHPVEHVEECLFCRQSYSFDSFAIHVYIGQQRCGGKIVVPNRMMHDLEMPFPLASSEVYANQTLTKEIVPRAVTTIEVRRRRLDWKVNQA